MLEHMFLTPPSGCESSHSLPDLMSGSPRLVEGP